MGRVVLDALLFDAALRLRSAGVADPRLEAELLLAHALGCARVSVMAGTAPEPVDGVLQEFRRLVEARARRVPFSYLTGAAEFYGRPFAVSPAVLVPRPETETLVDLALQYLRRAPAARVLDVGTGSGCIAVTLACECPAARVIATDASLEALALARVNARRHGVPDRVRLVAGDLFRPLFPAIANRKSPVANSFDLVLCNPPYVSEPALAACMPEVRDHEPRLATCGGPDGLGVIRRLAAGAPDVLARGGTLFLEVAFGQAPAAAALARGTGRYARVRTVRDIAGIERVVVAETSDATS